MSTQADVCLILEGTYPYVSGGVSSWTHELIKTHDHLTFALISLVSQNAPRKILYDIPSNVIDLRTLELQDTPEGEELSESDERTLCERIEPYLFKLQSQATLGDLEELIILLKPWQGRLGKKTLLESKAVWGLLLRMYQATMPSTSFLDYFWSWRGLFGSLFTLLLADLPDAKIYHSLCTGYAGLLLARAHIETKRPCLVTEHGIYTNERRIEIASADWIDDPKGFNLSILNQDETRDIKDLWTDTFGNYSRLCYEACESIITLFKGNQEFQKMDGAHHEKMCIIPNGIDYQHFSSTQKKPHPPTVALIGRVVPIKDIKTYIKSVELLKQKLPNLRAFIIGPEKEDPDYSKECRDLIDHLRLNETIIYTGSVNILSYLGEIDVLILTSLSEAQPLVILEAGAAGIPSVATDVGACREMILGTGQGVDGHEFGGAIVDLGSPAAVAQAAFKLLDDPYFYDLCSKAIGERVRVHYRKEDQRNSYAEIYNRLIRRGEKTSKPANDMAPPELSNNSNLR